MKLIIDIPKCFYERCKADEDAVEIRLAVKNGIPLDSNDSDYAEAQAYFDGQAYGWEEGRKALIDDIKAEISEEICLTDNPYTKETKYTIEHLKLLEILDNICKESEEESNE